MNKKVIGYIILLFALIQLASYIISGIIEGSFSNTKTVFYSISFLAFTTVGLMLILKKEQPKNFNERKI